VISIQPSIHKFSSQTAVLAYSNSKPEIINITILKILVLTNIACPN
jgi:hypothetical protein